MSDTLKCVACGESKPPGDFHRRSNTPTGRQAYCKTCARARAVRYYNETVKPYRHEASRRMADWTPPNETNEDTQR